jgi:VanZ family protein
MFGWLPDTDKAEHLVGFGLPVVLILLTLAHYGRTSPGWQWLVVEVFASHAVVSELIQRWFIPTRSGDPRDAGADVIGVALGWLVYRLIMARRHRRPDRNTPPPTVRSPG